jgi:hypothetical protein
MVVAIAFAIACGKKDENKAAPVPAPAGSAAAAPEPAADVSCKDASTAYAKLLAVDPGNPFGAAKPTDGQTMLLRYTLEEACEQDWPATARACLAKASSASAGGACFDAEMRGRVDQLVKQEIEEQLKNKAANEAAEKAGSGSAK